MPDLTRYNIDYLCHKSNAQRSNKATRIIDGNWSFRSTSNYKSFKVEASLGSQGHSFSTERISARCSVVRGSMWYFQGTGWLMTPAWNSGLTSTSCPFSIALLTLNTARDWAALRYTVLSAKKRPGHTRRPKPKAILCGSRSGSWPSVARKRSGLNVMGSW